MKKSPAVGKSPGKSPGTRSSSRWALAAGPASSSVASSSVASSSVASSSVASSSVASSSSLGSGYLASGSMASGSAFAMRLRSTVAASTASAASTSTTTTMLGEAASPTPTNREPKTPGGAARRVSWSLPPISSKPPQPPHAQHPARASEAATQWAQLAEALPRMSPRRRTGELAESDALGDFLSANEAEQNQARRDSTRSEEAAQPPARRAQSAMRVARGGNVAWAGQPHCAQETDGPSLDELLGENAL